MRDRFRLEVVGISLAPSRLGETILLPRRCGGFFRQRPNQAKTEKAPDCRSSGFQRRTRSREPKIRTLVVGLRIQAGERLERGVDFASWRRNRNCWLTIIQIRIPSLQGARFVNFKCRTWSPRALRQRKASNGSRFNSISTLDRNTAAKM